MELIEDTTNNIPNSNIYGMITTRIKEYIQPNKFIDKTNKNVDLIGDNEVYISIISISVLFTSIASMGVFKIGLLNTLIICLVVLSVLVFGYINFVKPAKHIDFENNFV